MNPTGINAPIRPDGKTKILTPLARMFIYALFIFNFPYEPKGTIWGEAMTYCQDTDVLEELLDLLRLEKIEANLYRGFSQDLGYGAVYGGQVIGQALSAAYYTVSGDRYVHSLHAYFLLPGDVRAPILYEVEPIRDGKSFTTRRVKAIQNGRSIFSASISFQVEEDGFDHQDVMPEVPGPDGLISDLELSRRIEERIPEKIRSQILCNRPIEVRPVYPFTSFDKQKRDPKNCYWMRTIGPLPDDPALHRYLLAYASDYKLTLTALLPHGQTLWDPGIQVASLDHALWFHRPFRMDEWLLYDMVSPQASGARGLGLGRIFSHDGRLVASVAQEGLIRKWNRD